MALLKQKNKKQKTYFLTVCSKTSIKSKMASLLKTTEWKNDGWHEPIDEIEHQKWFASLPKKTQEDMLRPPPKLAEWGMVYCGCHKCINTDYYLKNSVPANGMCLKVDAYEKILWEKSRKRFEPLVDSPSEHYKSWDTYKFDPIDMEEDVKYNTSFDDPKWLSFIAFGREQYKLYHDYKASIENTTTEEDYKKADKKYKDLATHIDKHGHIMWYSLKKEHVPPKKSIATDPTKIGRRLERKLRNDSESNAILSDSRVKKITDTQSYMTNTD